MKPDGGGLDEFSDVLAEVNNCVAVIFGYGHMLAREHEPPLAPVIGKHIQRYHMLHGKVAVDQPENQGTADEQTGCKGGDS